MVGGGEVWCLVGEVLCVWAALIAVWWMVVWFGQLQSQPSVIHDCFMNCEDSDL